MVDDRWQPAAGIDLDDSSNRGDLPEVPSHTHQFVLKFVAEQVPSKPNTAPLQSSVQQKFRFRQAEEPLSTICSTGSLVMSFAGVHSTVHRGEIEIG